MSGIIRQYRQIGPDGPILECLERPHSAAFLFYPGSMIEPGHYSLFINALYHAGFSVYGLHMSGHGRKIKSRVNDIQGMVTQGLTAQNWILQNKNQTLVVGGHSQGAICVLLHGVRTDVPAALFPICVCLPQLPSAIESTRFARFAPARDKLLAVMERIAKFFPNLPVPLPLYLSGRKILANCRRPVLTGKGVSRISYPMKFLYSLFTCHIPEKLLSPLFLIAASGDGLFPEHIIKECYEYLVAPRKKLIHLPEGGHLAILNPWLAGYCANICACASLSLNLDLNTEM